jgi:hypothetical protein
MDNIPSPPQVGFDELRIQLVPRQARKGPEDDTIYRLSLPSGHVQQVFECVAPDCGGSNPRFIREEMNQHQVIPPAVYLDRLAL